MTRNVAPFVPDTAALRSSIDDLEVAIAQRRRTVRGATAAWLQRFKTRLTSWPMLAAAGAFGFAVGTQTAAPATPSASDTDDSTPQIFGRAVMFSARLFAALRHLAG